MYHFWNGFLALCSQMQGWLLRKEPITQQRLSLPTKDKQHTLIDPHTPNNASATFPAIFSRRIHASLTGVVRLCPRPPFSISCFQSSGDVKLQALSSVGSLTKVPLAPCRNALQTRATKSECNLCPAHWLIIGRR